MKKIVGNNCFLYFLFFVTVIIFIFINTVLYSAVDMDFWARLIQGNAFFQLGSILKTDMFSYTPTHIWLDHEWGASIIFYLIQNLFGYIGILFFKTILVFLIFFFLYKTIRLHKKDNNLLFNLSYFILIVLALPTITQTWIRCHIFTFLFFTVSIYILEKVRFSKNYKLLYTLPFIMLFLVNINGGCVSLLCLLFIYFIFNFKNKKEYKHFIYVLLLSFLVMFINPYGLDYVNFIFMATTMVRPFVTEWISPFSHPDNLFLIEFKVLYLTNLILLLFSVKKFKQDYTKYILLIVCAYLSFKYVKNTPFFIIVSAIFLYDELFNVIDFLMKKIKINLNSSKLFIFISCIVIIFSFFKFLLNINYVYYPNLSMQPVDVVNFIGKKGLKGNILAPFDMGSYIVYKLFPNNLIYMDGRYEEVYYKETKDLLDNFYNVKENWDEILKQNYKHDYIIVPSNALVNDFLSKRNDFKRIYSDPYNILYINTCLKYEEKEVHYESTFGFASNPFKTSVNFIGYKNKIQKDK